MVLKLERERGNKWEKKEKEGHQSFVSLQSLTCVEQTTIGCVLQSILAFRAARPQVCLCSMQKKKKAKKIGLISALWLWC